MVVVLAIVRMTFMVVGGLLYLIVFFGWGDGGANGPGGVVVLEVVVKN